MTAPHGTADDYQRAQQEEWTRYRAIVPIDFYGQRAYNVGDPVPQSAVGDDPAAGRWVDPSWVADAGGGQTFQGSQTVPPPEPPTVDPALTAAPPGAAAAPPPEPADGGGSTDTGNGA
jgi:hypothetical protein